MEQKETIFQNRNTEHGISDNSSIEVVRPNNYIVDEQLAELRKLCETINPYEELSLEEKLRLQEFGITDFSNPFYITNQLLFILEENIQYRESLKN
ncbi:hypothetical protein [Bacteriovorax sp. Seq25_V]|uniref:hypothetical protein n=1 Tax=Bacteriovorax sp. Seq25_V TaxID=1201288 RepID=UPI00038A2539|nr:hypothetical protein [Bacteriovorax sp. Seq25_V]EQC46530.1 hypothetical protein M900_2410 [Bacteriovorax sp. Seq25_V]